MSNKRKIQFSEATVEQKSQYSMKLLSEGSFEEAIPLFEELIKFDHNNFIATTGLKCCRYWQGRFNTLQVKKDTALAKAIWLDQEWKRFCLFLGGQKNIQMEVYDKIMAFTYQVALDYLKVYISEAKVVDLSTIRLIGFFYKKLGDYRNAIMSFENVLRRDRQNSEVFAQLADCYAQLDEVRYAKVLFREAFFICPSAIEIQSLESNLIKDLIADLRVYKIPEEELSYWIPVYGRVLNVFDIRRELTPIEVGKIEKEIFHLEREADKDSSDQQIKARLVNYYLWLYDYNLTKGASANSLFDVEDKLKNSSLTIYNILKNSIGGGRK